MDPKPKPSFAIGILGGAGKGHPKNVTGIDGLFLGALQFEVAAKKSLLLCVVFVYTVVNHLMDVTLNKQKHAFFLMF